MTRINIGIAPSELCDQHLIAEYRELPRMVALSHRCKTIPVVPFTLGLGHMRSCIRFGAYLTFRHSLLIWEMCNRGFRPTLPPITVDQFDKRCRRLITDDYRNEAKLIIIERIRQRLATMKRKTWTNRQPPEWVRDLLP